MISALIAAGSLAAATLGGWPLMAGLLGWLRRHSPPEPQRRQLRGGTWVGILERLAVTGTILAGYPEGIAAVIALKGLGRFGELRDQPEASEPFLVGSMASLIWAAAIAFTASHFL